MLSEIRLQNFRGFDNHVIPLKSTSILVGQNNAGKSTITEALRLISIVASRYSVLNFSVSPKWLSLPLTYRGVRPSLKGLDFNHLSMFHNLGEPPATIEAAFDAGQTVQIHLGRNAEVFCVIKDRQGKVVNSKSAALRYPLPSVAILPQIGPVAREESILDSAYIRSVSSTPLASAHFRNHLRLYPEAFDEFAHLVESTWTGLKINSFEGKRGLPGDPLALLVQDGDFVAEIAWMGHGLQMWLQAMWFLARNKKAQTIILDEPDVYMHADLQRKLIRLLRKRHRQTIIATHSVEIMSEVDPADILIIDRHAPGSQFSTSLPVIQQAINMIGSIHNLELARLWRSRRFLLIEGKDLRYLKLIHDKLFQASNNPLDTIPNMQIGGWGGWPYAMGSRMLLNNAFGEKICAYCILDSDYHTEGEIEGRQRQAADKGISLHVWKKKEIENYLVVPTAIARYIAAQLTPPSPIPAAVDVRLAIYAILKKERDHVFDTLATEYQARDKRGGVQKANQIARSIVQRSWKSRDGRMSLVSGKKMISGLSLWSQQKYGVSLSAIGILRTMTTDELDTELVEVVSAIERGHAFH